MAESSSSSSSSPPPPRPPPSRSSGDRKFRRSPGSRLRMHAPSSIQVDPPTKYISEWKVAIPLLSPLDICSLPGSGDYRTVDVEQHNLPSEGDQKGSLGSSAWQDPATLFYYEPATSNAPTAFVFPHCA